MADLPYERGQQDGRHRARRHRRYDVPSQQASPLSGSDAEDERLRQDRLTPPLGSPPFYDAHSVSSRRTSDYTAYGVDGSIASSPHRNTNGSLRHSEHFTPPQRSMQHDNIYPPPPHNEDETFGTGAWTEEPFHGGLPQYTYGHNGLYYNTSQSHHSQPLEQPRLYQQPSRSASRYSDLGGYSRSDELPRHPRLTERRTAHTDARRGRHDHPERPEYHESHDYDEDRERHRRRARAEYYHEPERHYRPRPRGPH